MGQAQLGPQGSFLSSRTLPCPPQACGLGTLAAPERQAWPDATLHLPGSAVLLRKLRDATGDKSDDAKTPLKAIRNAIDKFSTRSGSISSSQVRSGGTLLVRQPVVPLVGTRCTAVL